MRDRFCDLAILFALLAVSVLPRQSMAEVDYLTEIAPVFQKYCAGCHNDADREGEFSAESFRSMSEGVEDRPAFLAGDPQSSLVFRLISGVDEPKMPPEDEPAPTPEEVEKIRQWLEEGAHGPEGEEPDRMTLKTPHVPSRTELKPITAVDWSMTGDALAIARFGNVEMQRQLRIRDAETGKKKQVWHSVAQLSDLNGKVNSVHFCLGGGKLITASGVAGLGGVATLWEWPLGRKILEVQGHRDLIYDAEVSPDGTLLATCSYDKDIILWDVKTGEPLRTLSGHNGAVYDIAFSPDGTTLASASADATCKIWRVRDGARLDTLGQPLREQYCVTFSPDGNHIAAGGADNRIRVWKFLSRSEARINPIVSARFAHEGPIVQLQYTADGKSLVSVSDDRSIKVWETAGLTETQVFENQPEVAMALSISPKGNQFVVGRMDGTLDFYPIKKNSKRGSRVKEQVAIEIRPKVSEEQPSSTVAEVEPNQSVQSAQDVSLPVTITGVIHSDEETDEDCFRFSAEEGEEWVFEVDAARSKSPLDSIIDIRDESGRPVERVLLQAVRDSYFTFRGKTADQSNDFRVFNWDEMTLNEYLYANGEVVKLWLYPRGPDSGYNVYPGSGSRWGYFDTTPLAHALGEPCYIVRPYPPGSEIIPNGLPVFTVHYENDDESRRQLGKDSRLYFVAPKTGRYVLRIRDVRGMSGENFQYKLIARSRTPDFRAHLVDRKLNVPSGGAAEFRLKVDRLDNFDGEITVDVSGLPPRFRSSLPVTIEREQLEAQAVLIADPGAESLTEEELSRIEFTASANVRGERVRHPLEKFDTVSVEAAPKVHLVIGPAAGGVQPVATSDSGILEFEIRPGETIMLEVNAERHDYDGLVSFGNEDSGRNLPHGLYVDNIGLNGLLLPENQTQREFFVTADDWVPPQTRLFHLRTGNAGGHATLPVRLRILPNSPEAEAGAE
ncbi:translocation protein TolB [Thalassoglobus neptunius]|uniref:Translocation protein TolB n=1 Tax=Thalassoglobus neptunius TaxID=1938619 RepID=A0A5C5WAQ5_9PLAN|nr:c-type cytochrome domain-containing protein [Thalassoglobus neptunius]TWT47091.1 translocation protein TolB [Thalassoglobus neptunius]